jgi:hypothetical protein
MSLPPILLAVGIAARRAYQSIPTKPPEGIQANYTRCGTDEKVAAVTTWTSLKVGRGSFLPPLQGQRFRPGPTLYLMNTLNLEFFKTT